MKSAQNEVKTCRSIAFSVTNKTPNSKKMFFLASLATWSIGYCDCDEHGFGPKPAQAIQLYPWERHFSLLGTLGKLF